MTGKQLALLRVAERYGKDGSARRIRTSGKVSMLLMSQSVGVAESTISRWENGLRRPRGEAAIRWVELLLELDEANKKADRAAAVAA